MLLYVLLYFLQEQLYMMNIDFYSLVWFLKTPILQDHQNISCMFYSFWSLKPPLYGMMENQIFPSVKIYSTFQRRKDKLQYDLEPFYQDSQKRNQTIVVIVCISPYFFIV